jgi:hypothetical protein
MIADVAVSTRVIRPASTEARIAGGLFIGVFAVVSTLVSLSDSLEAGGSSFVTWGAGLTAAAWVGALYGTSHIATHADQLVFADLVVERIVPAALIASVDGTNGVRVQLVDGRTLGSLAYGSSSLQVRRPFAGYRHAASQIETWLAEPRTGRTDALRMRVRPRRAALTVLLAAAAASSAWMAVLWGFAGPIRRLLGIGE